MLSRLIASSVLGHSHRRLTKEIRSRLLRRRSCTLVDLLTNTSRTLTAHAPADTRLHHGNRIALLHLPRELQRTELLQIPPLMPAAYNLLQLAHGLRLQRHHARDDQLRAHVPAIRQAFRRRPD